LPENERPNRGQDTLFFEIKSEKFESFYEKFLLDLTFLQEEDVFEIPESKFHYIRASIPRAVYEENSKLKVTKMGTDVQVPPDRFSDLIEIYKDFSKQGVRYNLFGHFGDAHLHFNFMPQQTQIDLCQKKFQQMYTDVKTLKASPFAEHGIGIIKQNYIKEYWNGEIFKTFSQLKEYCDPHNQFFPQGFMSVEQ
jgi:glycolate oxidase